MTNRLHVENQLPHKGDKYVVNKDDYKDAANILGEYFELQPIKISQLQGFDIRRPTKQKIGMTVANLNGVKRMDFKNG